MKWDLIEEADAPTNQTGMSQESKEKLALLTALTPGKVARVDLGTADGKVHRSFKATLTRLADKPLGLKIVSWSDGNHVYTRLKPSEAEGQG